MFVRHTIILITKLWLWCRALRFKVSYVTVILQRINCLEPLFVSLPLKRNYTVFIRWAQTIGNNTDHTPFQEVFEIFNQHCSKI